MFEFKIKNIQGLARTGTLETPHGEIQTPVFMPVGTKANVKTVTGSQLEDLGAQIMLANTYHLFLRPGEKLIKKMGGLHKWSNWNKPILTDSGGFQVFSLKKFNKITDEGVEFRSYLDGTKHFLTPEKAIKIQEDLGADIIMAFDECAPGKSSKRYAKDAMKRTHEWAVRCKKAHTKKDQALFPIIQGVTYDDLRIESAKFISDLDLPGVAIGGLSVGESKEQMYHTLEIVEPHLPKEKPRYLMGVGTPEDLLEAVSRGIDMFDCVLPTRLGRHGAFWNHTGRHTITNKKFAQDSQPLDKKCTCYTCKNHSASYLRHLIIEKELLGMHLMTIHNLSFILQLMKDIRESIDKGTFNRFKTQFFKNYKC
ncbi:MAG: tRNA guanosine(34) transglycosylase Tgt [Patescibacteria group bacterium]|nr:tRNA guanosine(34) transglycosylase Tgt [Patescibacteria group bacterium]